jgi:hypothetical protein
MKRVVRPVDVDQRAARPGDVDSRQGAPGERSDRRGAPVVARNLTADLPGGAVRQPIGGGYKVPPKFKPGD